MARIYDNTSEPSSAQIKDLLVVFLPLSKLEPYSIIMIINTRNWQCDKSVYSRGGGAFMGYVKKNRREIGVKGVVLQTVKDIIL